MLLIIIFPFIDNLPYANLSGIYTQCIIHSCMDSRKLVSWFQSSGEEPSLGSLSKSPSITISRDRIQFKVFSPLDLVLLTVVVSSNHSSESNPWRFMFLTTKVGRPFLQSTPSPFQVFQLTTERCPMILELRITFAESCQPTLFCWDITYVPSSP